MLLVGAQIISCTEWDYKWLLINGWDWESVLEVPDGVRVRVKSERWGPPVVYSFATREQKGQHRYGEEVWTLEGGYTRCLTPWSENRKQMGFYGLGLLWVEAEQISVANVMGTHIAGPSLCKKNPIEIQKVAVFWLAATFNIAAIL